MRKVVSWLEKNFTGFIQFVVVWAVVSSAVPLIYFWFRTDQITAIDDLYFVMSSGREMFVWMALYLVIIPRYRFLILPYLLYLITLFVWQIITLLTDIDANHPITVIVIFSTLLTGVIILFLKDLIHRSKKQ